MALTARLPLFIAIFVVGTTLPKLQPTALAAGLDERGKAILKQATRFFKQGMYDQAAKMLSDLSVDHPEMAILKRHLGACFHHMGQPEPALSNLRDYLAQKKDGITAEDNTEVERWIDEMEKLRVQNAAAAVQAPPAAPIPQAPSTVSPSTIPVESSVQIPSQEPGAEVGRSPGDSSPLASPPHPQTEVPAPKSPPATDQLPPAPQSVPPRASKPPIQETSPVVADTRRDSSLPPGTNPTSGLRIFGAVVAVAGLGLVGTGGYYSWRTKDLESSVASARTFNSADYNAGTQAQTLQWVFYGAGAGGTILGLVLYLAGGRDSQPEARNVSLVPWFGSNTGGLSAHGAF